MHLNTNGIHTIFVATILTRPLCSILPPPWGSGSVGDTSLLIPPRSRGLPASVSLCRTWVTLRHPASLERLVFSPKRKANLNQHMHKNDGQTNATTRLARCHAHPGLARCNAQPWLARCRAQPLPSARFHARHPGSLPRTVSATTWHVSMRNPRGTLPCTQGVLDQLIGTRAPKTHTRR